MVASRWRLLILGSLLVGALSLAAAAAAGNDQLRPMKGSCVASFVFTGPNVMTLSGTCLLTHLGFTSWTGTQTVSAPVNGVQQMVNDTVYTAANGDQLRMHFVGAATQTGATTLTFAGTETYTGGTGRFAEASGESSLIGGATFSSFLPVPSGTGFWSTSGSIAY